MGSLKLSVTNLLVHGWDIFPHGKLSVTYLHKQTYWEAVCKYTLKNLLKYRYFNCTDISQLDYLCDILILNTYSNGKLSLKYLHSKDILPMEVFSDLPTMRVHLSHGKPFIYVAIRQRKNLFPMGSFL